VCQIELRMDLSDTVRVSNVVGELGWLGSWDGRDGETSREESKSSSAEMSRAKDVVHLAIGSSLSACHPPVHS
jgi:hypothetical protein